jgi:hypothetical protein
MAYNEAMLSTECQMSGTQRLDHSAMLLVWSISLPFPPLWKKFHRHCFSRPPDQKLYNVDGETWSNIWLREATFFLFLFGEKWSPVLGSSIGTSIAA